MPLNYSKLRNLTARQIYSALEKDAFQLIRVVGSHHRYHHADGRKVTINFHHPSDTFKRKTLKSIIEKQAHWTEADLMRLKLVK